MGVRIEDKKIDGVVFRVTQLPFKDSRRLFTRLARILGPSIMALAQGTKSLAGIDLAAVASRAIEALTDTELDEISDQLAEVSAYSLDGVKFPPLLFKGTGGNGVDNRDQVFEGRLMLFFEWLWFALEVQYSDFFAALKKALGSARKQEGQAPDATPGSSAS